MKIGNSTFLLIVRHTHLPARTYDGESVSSDHIDFPCNVITVDVNFEEREIHIIRNPGDGEKARIEARKEVEH